MQSGNTMPGYTGYKPAQEQYSGSPNAQREGGAHIPGKFSSRNK